MARTYRLGGLARTVLAIFLLTLAVSLGAFAQGSGGSIGGRVVNADGAPVPGAQVIITNSDTGISRTLVSNSSGLFEAPGLEAGNWVVKVSIAGFKSVQRTVTLTVGAQASANVTLHPGTGDEVQNESSATPASTGASGGAVEGKAVRDLPLNGRDWTQLGNLQPGVHDVGTQVQIASGSNARGNRGWGAQASIGGNRPQSSAYNLDGININDYAGSAPGSVLGMNAGADAVREFTMITTTPTPDYGRTGGGVLNAVTRSGTNQFHGSVFEFLRNSALDTRNYFDAPGKPVPPFKRNQFGVTAGGPIRRNKTFIFGDYEGLRQSLSTTTVDTVPSPNARAGILCANKACTSTRQAVIDPNVVPFIALFPVPNGAINGDAGEYSFVSNALTREDTLHFKVDHKLTERDVINGTFMSDDSSTEGPDAYNFVDLRMISNRKLISFEENHIFSNNLLNNFRVGYSRSVSIAPEGAAAIDPRAADPSYGYSPNSNIGTTKITGITTFPGGIGAQSTYMFHYNSYQAYDNVSYVHGDHVFKFGGAFEHIRQNEFGQVSDGYFEFGSWSDFLTNQPTTYQGSFPGGNPVVYLHQNIMAGYAMDTWKLRPNLTLTYGLRYEAATVPSDPGGHLVTLPTLTSATAHTGDPYFKNPTWRNFSPRFGFTWDPSKKGKFVVRGGAGIYDNLPLTYQFELLAINNAPYTLSGQIGDKALLKGKFPIQAFDYLTENTLRTSYVQPNPGRSYVEQWNFGIQAKLPWKLVADVSYNGSHGVHLPWRTNDSNVVLPTIGADGRYYWPKENKTRLNTSYGVIDTMLWNVSSVYNGMKAKISRSTKTLRVSGSYTWSKGMDTGSSSVSGGNFSNSLNGQWIFNPLRGRSDFDIAQNFSADFLWTLPSLKQSVLRPVLGGWQLSGILKMSTGQPFTPTIGGDPYGLSNNNPFGLPSLSTEAGCKNPVNSGSIHYIKLECFYMPYDPASETPVLGDVSRNSLTGPGTMNVDASLIKDVRVHGISETFNIQFRVEGFNILNHTNFRTPDRTIAQIFKANGALVNSAGTLNSTTGTSRQIQLALKVIW